MNHVFELKTGKGIELTSDELLELIGLMKILIVASSEKPTYQIIPCPPYRPAIIPMNQFPDPYPNPFREIVIASGSV